MRIISIVVLLGLVGSHCAVKAGFAPHEYGCSRFNNYLGPQHNWENDLAPAFLHNDFVVVIHGVVGAGKSSLIKLLCGHQNDLQIGQKLPDSSNIRSVTDRANVYNCRSRTSPQSATIFVIDTPGFEEPNEAGQLCALEGVDRALRFAREQRAPLRRIYFLMDWSDPKEPIPLNLENHLHILLARYGSLVASRIRFVISKSDRLYRMGRPQVHIKQMVAFTGQCYKNVFQLAMVPKQMVFVSLNAEYGDCPTIRQLTTDFGWSVGGNDARTEL